MTRAGVALLFAAALLGCESDASPPRFPTVEGGICIARADPQCVDADTLLVCIERAWTAQSCADVCAADGLVPTPLGCVPGVDGFEDSCACQDSCDISPTCANDDSIDACVDGVASTLDCSEVCAGMEPPRVSLGCDDSGWTGSCTCSLTGTPCNVSDVSPRCDSPTTIATCVGDAWAEEDCGDACGADEFGYCRSSLVDGQVEVGCICEMP